MNDYVGKLLYLSWTPDRVRVLGLQGHKDSYRLPEPLFKAAWNALGDKVHITVNAEGVVESLRVTKG